MKRYGTARHGQDILPVAFAVANQPSRFIEILKGYWMSQNELSIVW